MRNYTEYESQFISSFVEHTSIGNIIREQLSTALLEREYCQTSCFVSIDANKLASPLGNISGVPFEVIIDPVADWDEVIFCNERSSINISEDAVASMLHFKNGFICELEIYSPAGKPLNINAPLRGIKIVIELDSVIT